jgi:predicted HTH domain antitoxin
MMTLHLHISDEAYKALKLPLGRVEEELQQGFAVFLVKEGLLGPAQARTITKMDRLAFQELLARRKVEWGGKPEDALQDLEAARAAVQPDRA